MIMLLLRRSLYNPVLFCRCKESCELTSSTNCSVTEEEEELISMKVRAIRVQDQIQRGGGWVGEREGGRRSSQIPCQARKIVFIRKFKIVL